MGITGGEQLLDCVVADPDAQRFVAITGPGGCGKSALLSALAAAYRDAGVGVVAADALDDDVSTAGVVVLDDAHQSSPSVVERLGTLVRSPGVRLFVAARPQPHRTDVVSLVSALRSRGQELQLQHLDRLGVERRATAQLDVCLSEATVDLLHEDTGGLAVLVDEVLDSWRAHPASIGAAGPSVPAEVIDRAQRLIGRVDATSRAVLHAVAIGCELEWEVVSAVLGIELAGVREAVASAQATGLLLPDGRAVPIVARAILQTASAQSTKVLQARLLRVRHDLQRDTVPLARMLARDGWQDRFLASLLVSAGDRLRTSDPANALALYTDAVDAGASTESLAVRRAECAARCGRFALALQLIDPVLAEPDRPDFAGGLEIAAAALIPQGQLDRAGELYSWVGRDRIGGGVSTAVVAMLATGRRHQASELLGAEQPTATLIGGIRSLIARGVHESIDGDEGAALSTLMRATAMLEVAERSTLLVDTPSALAALLALHAGQVDVAESALIRAVENDVGGQAAWSRHRLLLAWIAMLRGRYGRAQRLLAEIAVRVGDNEHTLRDELFLRALQLGIARRTSDVAGLVAGWKVGREVLLRHPVDLFTLLPLGEFAVVAARLREFERVRPHLTDAWSLLRELGEPVTWSPALHWYAVQAAILRERPNEVEPHAVALVRAARQSAFAAALADGGRAWMQVLSGEIEPAFVEPAARRLQSFGLAWDGSRLLGQAAAHSTDRRTIASLMQAARSMQQPDDQTIPDPSPRDAAVTVQRAPSELLSARELEVADLLVQQRTYREIGQQLFISPKTVEHHVARIKQRLGVSGRSDLLARLRAFNPAADRS